MQRIVTGGHPAREARGIYETAHHSVRLRRRSTTRSRFVLTQCSNRGLREQSRAPSCLRGEPTRCRPAHPVSGQAHKDQCHEEAGAADTASTLKGETAAQRVRPAAEGAARRQDSWSLFQLGHRGDSPSRATGTWRQTRAGCLVG